jgi:hypothetical protein
VRRQSTYRIALLKRLRGSAGEPGILMVEPNKTFPVRQTATGGWQVVSDLPFHGDVTIGGDAPVT